MEEIEKYWKDSFNNSAVKNLDDFKIAQWSEHGLSVRLNYFKKIFSKNRPAQNDTLILDAGCGSGIYSLFLQNEGYKILAIDFSTNMLDVTRNKLGDCDSHVNSKYVNSDVNLIPLKSNTVDFIITFGVFQHIHDVTKVLTEFNRILRSSGTILINAPNKKFLLKRSREHYNWYDPKEMGIFAKQQGFSASSYDYLYIMPKYFHWLESLLNYKLLNRLIPVMAHDFILLLTK